MKEQVLKILYLDISKIKEYENNSKEHPEWQISQISKSIQEFGFNDPIAFYGKVPNLWVVIYSQFFIKLVLALLDTPFFYYFTKENTETIGK